MLRKVFIILLLALLAAALDTPAVSQARKIVLIVAAGTSISDVTSSALPNLSSFLSNSSAAVISLRTGKAPNYFDPMFVPVAEPGCVTVGAGAPAIADQNARLAERADKCEVFTDFTARTGRKVEAENILALCMPQVAGYNEAGAYRAIPGLLGQMLHDNGLKTAVIGNSDAGNEKHREVAYIAVDSTGVADRGDVSSGQLNIASDNHAFGTIANIEYLINQTKMELRECALVVVDCGDTLRLDMYSQLCLPERLPDLKLAALQSLDRLVGGMQTALGPDTDIVVMSPSTAVYSTGQTKQVGWIALKGKNHTPGLLTTPSTRRQGIVVLTDIAPTLLNILGLEVPNKMVGRAASGIPADPEAALDLLQSLDRQAAVQAERIIVMRGCSVLLTVIVAAVTLVFLKRKYLPDWCLWAAALTCSIPVSLLLSSRIWDTGALGTALVVLVLTAVQLLFAVKAFGRVRSGVIFSCLLGLSLTFLDIVFDFGLIRSSPIGYSLAEGARFYGIGNELMGVFLGSAILAISLTGNSLARVGRSGLLLPSVLLTCLFIILGSPSLGANVGGALAAMPAAAAYIMVLSGKRPTFRGVSLVLLIAAGAIGITFLVDYMRGASEQSHAARMLSLLQSGGATEALQLVLRKLHLNLVLLIYSLWSRLLIVAVVSAVVLLRKSARSRQAACRQSEKAGIAALAVATAAAFLFNDSGVLAAATCSIYLWILAVLQVPKEPETLADYGT